jgi:hypothetical protein
VLDTADALRAAAAERFRAQGSVAGLDEAIREQLIPAGAGPERRIVTIEDPIEVALPRPRLKQLEVRHPNQEGLGIAFGVAAALNGRRSSPR